MGKLKTFKKIFLSFTNKSSGYLGKPGEMGPDFYDQAFDGNDEWRIHYTQSEYYFLWAVILGRIKCGNFKKVLDIGCGSGQLAKAIDDSKLIEDYCGIDFSQLRIDYAKTLCPEYQFVAADIFKSTIFSDYSYDLVIATELLEHIESDLAVLEKIAPSKVFIGTVPNFPWISHVRYFESAIAVEERYAHLFSNFNVLTLKANDKGKTFFLLQGVKL